MPSERRNRPAHKLVRALCAAAALALLSCPAPAQEKNAQAADAPRTRLLILAYLPDADPSLRSLTSDVTFKTFVKRVEKSPRVEITAGEEPSYAAAPGRAALDRVEIVDRARAVERARAQKTTYVVLLQMAGRGTRGPSRVDATREELDYVVFAPATADIVAQGTVDEFLPNQGGAASSSPGVKRQGPFDPPVRRPATPGPNGSLVVPSADATAQPYNYDAQRRAGRETAERVLAALGLK